MIVTIDTDKLHDLARTAYRERAKIRDWNYANPDGPSGTPEQRNVERLRRALKIAFETHGVKQ